MPGVRQLVEQAPVDGLAGGVGEDCGGREDWGGREVADEEVERESWGEGVAAATCCRAVNEGGREGGRGKKKIFGRVRECESRWLQRKWDGEGKNRGITIGSE